MSNGIHKTFKNLISKIQILKVYVHFIIFNFWVTMVTNPKRVPKLKVAIFYVFLNN